MKKKPIGRRGRKPGDGVLKEIAPQAPALQIALKLAFGRTANDPIAEMVRTFRHITRACKELEALEKKLGQERITAAESVESSTDGLAVRYWQNERFLKSWLRDVSSKLDESAYCAMLSSNADWFRKVAEAIEAEAKADDQDTFPLHSTVLRLFGQLRHTINKDGVRCYRTDAPLDRTPRYTIDEACKQLEQHGQRHTESDVDWQRTVRRAFEQVGLKIKTSKPGPKKS